MSLTGNRVFRSALLIESAANIGSMIPMITNPELVLSYLVRGPAQITPAAKSLTQWFGGLIVLATVPLVLSYPEGDSSSTVNVRRRISYLSMGSAEVALGAIALSQYIGGNSGLTDVALLTATGMMFTLAGMRSYFLFAQPKFMEVESSIKKAQ